MTDAKGTIFNIQRASLDDGPGVRTVLFFKGCPLRCPWCHNPESQNWKPELMTLHDRCIGCGACSVACPIRAIEKTRIDRSLCEGCGKCAEACPGGALEMAGRLYSAEEAVREAVRDAAFFEATGGGVTLSGGEPLAQPGFARDVLKSLKERGIHTCVETCGICADGAIDALIPYVDEWLYDIKLTDEAAHLSMLGAPLSTVLHNLHILKEARANITLRCPIVPGVNDTESHFAAIRTIAREVSAMGVDVLLYHRLGSDKHQRLGREALQEFPVPSAEQIAAWERAVLE